MSEMLRKYRYTGAHPYIGIFIKFRHHLTRISGVEGICDLLTPVYDWYYKSCGYFKPKKMSEILQRYRYAGVPKKHNRILAIYKSSDINLTVYQWLKEFATSMIYEDRRVQGFCFFRLLKIDVYRNK